MSVLQTDSVRREVTLETGPPLVYEAEEPSQKGAGWVLFAMIMFGLAACLNIIWGIAAVSSSHFFVANAHYVISDLNTWGWIVMAFGAAQALAGLSIWRGGAFGRWFGIIVAGLAVIAAMLSIPAYPFWSLLLVALDVMIIYGLAVYGGKPAVTW
jgi:hypothetical protein